MEERETRPEYPMFRESSMLGSLLNSFQATAGAAFAVLTWLNFSMEAASSLNSAAAARSGPPARAGPGPAQ